MKNKLLTIFAVLAFSSFTSFSSITTSSSKFTSIIDAIASCFEEGFYFSQWVGAIYDLSAYERMEIALWYYELCEYDNTY